MDFSRDEVVEQPTPGEERRLVVPNPAADDTQVGERVRDRLHVSYAGVGLGQGGIHRFAALDQVTQQPPLGSLAALGRQELNKGFPLTPPRRYGMLQGSVVLVSSPVHVMEKQLGQVGMVPSPRCQSSTRFPADQPSR